MPVPTTASARSAAAAQPQRAGAASGARRRRDRRRWGDRRRGVRRAGVRDVVGDVVWLRPPLGTRPRRRTVAWSSGDGDSRRCRAARSAPGRPSEALVNWVSLLACRVACLESSVGSRQCAARWRPRRWRPGSPRAARTISWAGRRAPGWRPSRCDADDAHCWKPAWDDARGHRAPIGDARRHRVEGGSMVTVPPSIGNPRRAAPICR